jgi:hypothetical protein
LNRGAGSEAAADDRGECDDAERHPE